MSSSSALRAKECERENLPEHFGDHRKRFRLDDSDLDESRLATVELGRVQIGLDVQRQFGCLDRFPRELYDVLPIALAGNRQFAAQISRLTDESIVVEELRRAFQTLDYAICILV